MNGERIPLWLTDDKKAKTRVDFTNQIWATYKMRNEAETYHCNGDSSYIAFMTYTLDEDYIRSISAEINTASEDGLIMFYGEGSVQVYCRMYNQQCTMYNVHCIMLSATFQLLN